MFVFLTVQESDPSSNHQVVIGLYSDPLLADGNVATGRIEGNSLNASSHDVPDLPCTVLITLLAIHFFHCTDVVNLLQALLPLKVLLTDLNKPLFYLLQGLLALLVQASRLIIIIMAALFGNLLHVQLSHTW